MENKELKLNKKIGLPVTYIPIAIETRIDLVAVIEDLSFIKEEDLNYVSVFMGTRAENESFIDEIYLDDGIQVNNLDELKILALNWYFDNVEVIKSSNETNIYSVDKK